ncbi:hypothetical protein LIER_37857 [Lithospermum erythrorhizon]|uniref:Uncharacterized protein n=1 Tax=Lithospermum erythrorhizon TaxID=34254 RepID=A0AAV3PRE8_LITER
MSESSKAPSAHNNQCEKCQKEPVVPTAVPAAESNPTTQRFQKELEDIKEMIKELMPTAAPRREYTYQQTSGAFIAKFGSGIQAQDERALMDIEQEPIESLKSYQKH